MVSQNISNTMPSYYIYRDGSANQPFDPTAPLQFFPPKDSDALFFALRNAFPAVATHSERMRNAVIEFLVSEGQMVHASPSQSSPAVTNSASTSPYLSMTDSYSSSSASPVALSSYSPTTVTVPSVAGESSQTPPAPALEQMTSVFSLTSHTEPKLRSRRKMTEAEKVEYRKRRTAGACASCSARKRKCKHVQISQATDSSCAARVTKPLSQKARGKQPQRQSFADLPLHSQSAVVASLPEATAQPLLDLGQSDLLDLFSFEDTSFTNDLLDVSETIPMNDSWVGLSAAEHSGYQQRHVLDNFLDHGDFELFPAASDETVEQPQSIAAPMPPVHLLDEQTHHVVDEYEFLQDPRPFRTYNTIAHRERRTSPAWPLQGYPQGFQSAEALASEPSHTSADRKIWSEGAGQGHHGAPFASPSSQQPVLETAPSQSGLFGQSTLGSTAGPSVSAHNASYGGCASSSGNSASNAEGTILQGHGGGITNAGSGKASRRQDPQDPQPQGLQESGKSLRRQDPQDPQPQGLLESGKSLRRQDPQDPQHNSPHMDPETQPLHDMQDNAASQSFKPQNLYSCSAKGGRTQCHHNAEMSWMGPRHTPTSRTGGAAQQEPLPHPGRTRVPQERAASVVASQGNAGLSHVKASVSTQAAAPDMQALTAGLVTEWLRSIGQTQLAMLQAWCDARTQTSLATDRQHVYEVEKWQMAAPAVAAC